MPTALRSLLKTYRPELADTVRLAIPIVIAQLGVVLMGVTDNLFVGRLLGAVPLGAAGLANSLSFLVSSVGVGGLAVVAALVSQAAGRSDSAAIGQFYRAGLRVALLLGVAQGVVMAALVVFFHLFGQPAEVTALARPFVAILGISNIPLFIFIAARQLSDGLRFPRVAMVITLGALALNALFNYLLILGIGPFPRLGLNGSAISTLLARVFMAVAMIIYVARSGKFQPYVTLRTAPLAGAVRQILKLGLPGGLTFFFEIALFSLAMVIVGWLGADRLAAHQIALNLASSTYMVATGVSTVAAIRVGGAVGRQDRTGAYRAGIAAFVLVGVFMSGCALLFFTANDWLVGLYIRTDPHVAQLAASLVILGGFFQLSDGIQVVGIGTLRGLSDVNVPTAITLFAYWVVALPLSYLLGITLRYDAAGVWIGMLAGLTIAAVLLSLRFFRQIKSLRYEPGRRAV